MLMGHLAVGLALKARFKRAPMLPLLLAVQLLDWIWLVLVWLGQEQIHLKPESIFLQYDFSNAVYSHSLFWSIFYAIVTFLLFIGASEQRHWATPLSLGVLSHWPLDWLLHDHDLPFANFGPDLALGLGLQTLSSPAAFLLETLLLAVGWLIYYRSVRRDGPRQNRCAWGILATLLLLNVCLYAFPLLLG